MLRVPYTKGYLTVPEQVELLRGRGMVIPDGSRAEAWLHRIGYYRLSGYSFPFRHKEIVRAPNRPPLERVLEQFRPGTDFSLVTNLYVFDKRLRLLFLDALERVEVGLRVELALVLGQKGAFAYRDAGSFNAYFSTPDPSSGVSPHSKFVAKLDEAFDRSREEFADHFRAKYDSPLPIWMLIELWDFGTLATVLQGMQTADLDRVAALFGIPRRGILQSWAQSLNFIRNICAHHGRLWNRPLVLQPSPGRSGEVVGFEHLVEDTHAQRRLYAAAATLQYLMRYIHPVSTWGARLKRHLETLPASPHISARQMGFPDHWSALNLWNAED